MREEIRRKIDERIVSKAISQIESSPPEYIPGIIDPSIKPFNNEPDFTVKGADSGDKPEKKKKKRAPSKYNLFIGDCMKSGNDMKTCAEMYKSDPGQSFGNSVESVESVDSDVMPDITLLVEEYCPTCVMIKEALEPLISEGLIKIEDVNLSSDYDEIKAIPAAVVDGKVCEITSEPDGLHLKCQGEDDVVISIE